MKFYTNVFVRGDKVYVRGYQDGKPVEDIIHYKPYLFIPKKGGKYNTLDGQDVEKIDFDSIREAKKFIEDYGSVSNMKIFGLTNFLYLYIYDNFHGEINYDPSLVSKVSLDIECAADEGFPNIQKADKEITAITIRKDGISYVFGCGEFVTNNKNIFYVKTPNEYELLMKFLQAWKFLKPEIITGWNIEFFDIPYLYNRIKALLGESEAKKLSHWGIVDEKILNFKGKENQTYSLAGISVLDYYQLYRKFTFGNQESYKLDYIAQIELGEKKLDYSEYGSLLELYKNNFQKFIEYNILDTVLVDKLEEKLKFIEQVMAFAYDAKVNYSDTMTTVRPWDIIIHNYLLDSRIVIPQMNKNEMTSCLVGGYVKEPKIGLSKWVVSFDLNSLYPHLIMQYNISPETFVGRFERFDSIDTIISNPDIKYSKAGPDGKTECAIAANGCYYRTDKQGFLPALMEKMYNDRTEYKKKMIEAKIEYEKTKDKKYEKLIAQYHNMQLAKKIQLNSAYGALGNEYFRWFNFNHAEAITTSGQLSIRWIEKMINEFMNKILKTKDEDYVIASDTDSIYVTFEKLIPENCSELEAVKALDEFCEQKIQPFINKCYEQLANRMSAYQQKMFMKRETIANKGIWKAKKMYILNAWDVEGVQYDKPKLKMQGIEAVRSSTPHACRENIKKALDIIMNGTESDLRKFVADFKEKFVKLSFEDVAFPRGVNGMNKYKDSRTVYTKGTPIHVKGALLFNKLLLQYNIKTIPPIGDGDKIKFAYLKLPNIIGDTVIATSDYLPEEFNLDKYIDRELQFKKAFLEPLKSITEIIGWEPEQLSTLEGFFT